MNKDSNALRLPWLDNAKMLAMFCVILGHTAQLVPYGVPGRLQGLIVAFNMPLFVLLAGYTSLGGLLRIDGFRSLLEYAERVMWRMILPAVTLSAVVQGFEGTLFARKLWLIYAFVAIALWMIERWGRKLTKMLDHWLVRGALTVFLLVTSLWLNMYWFLAMLMKLQLASAVLCYLGNARIKPAYLIPVSGVLVCMGYYLCHDSWTFEMSAYFTVGLVLKQLGGFDMICKCPLWLSIIFAMAGVAACRLFTIDFGFYNYGLERLLAEGHGWIYVVRIIVALLLCFAVIRWVVALSIHQNWFSRMGQRSLAFYTVHVFILEVCLLPYFHYDNAHGFMWLFGILVAVVLTAITYIIICMCERWRLTRGLVLGDWGKSTPRVG